MKYVNRKVLNSHNEYMTNKNKKQIIISLSGDNNLIPINNKTFKTECCDCGLIHLWELTENGFLISLDKKLTKERRKARQIKIRHIARKREKNDT